MIKRSIKHFLKNPSDYLLGTSLILIVFAGLGLYYWHLKNLDFFGFDRLMVGPLGENGVALNDQQEKQILKYERISIISGIIFCKIILYLGISTKDFSKKYVKIGSRSLWAFFIMFILSLFLKVELEQYYIEHLHQMGMAVVIGILFASAYSALPKKNCLFQFLSKHRSKIFWGLFFFFSIWYLTVGLVKFLHINHGGLDYTFFTQGIWHYSRLEEPIITYGGATKNFHAEHAHFFMILVAPILAIFNSPFTLLFIDIFSMLSMGIVIYLLLQHWGSKKAASRVIGQSTFLLIALSIAIFFFFGIQRALEHEFHEANLIAPLFLWTFYFLHTGKIKWYFIFLFILLLSKESSPIWVIFLGLYAIFFEKKIKVGLISMLAAIIYFPIVLGWIIPDLVGNGSYQHFSFKGLGDTPKEVVLSVLTNPALAFHTIFNAPPDYLAKIENAGTLEAMTQMKRNTLSHFFASFGFTSLFSPQILFLGIPMIGERFLNSDDWRWSIYLYYNISYLPILALSTLFGLRNILSKKFFCHEKTKRIKNSGKFLIVLVSGIILTMSILVNVKKKPMLLDVYNENFWTFTDQEKTIWELSHIIPQEATLQTQSTILPFFAHRDYIKSFPRGQHSEGQHNSGHNFWKYVRHWGAMESDDATRVELLKQKKQVLLDIKKSARWKEIEKMTNEIEKKIAESDYYSWTTKDIETSLSEYDQDFKNLADFYIQEPEYTILNSNFTAFPLRAKEDVDLWITKMRATHDIVYEKYGTIVFRRKDIKNIIDKEGNYPYKIDNSK